MRSTLFKYRNAQTFYVSGRGTVAGRAEDCRYHKFFSCRGLIFCAFRVIIILTKGQMRYHGVHQPASTERGRGLFLFFEVVMPLLHFGFMRFSITTGNAIYSPSRKTCCWASRDQDFCPQGEAPPTLSRLRKAAANRPFRPQTLLCIAAHDLHRRHFPAAV